jgi:hypothetical protein
VLIRRQFQILVTTLALLASAFSAGAQDVLFSPNLRDIVPRQFEQANNWSKLPPSYTFGTALSGNIPAANTFAKSRELPPGTGISNDQFRIGASYLEIQTRKILQPFEVLRRSGCETDEECAEYSGLPKSEPSKQPIKGLKKPFFGLSITTPLQ